METNLQHFSDRIVIKTTEYPQGHLLIYFTLKNNFIKGGWLGKALRAKTYALSVGGLGFIPMDGIALPIFQAPH